MVEEREERGERGDALHHLILHVTAARLPTGVCWLKSREGGQVHGGAPTHTSWLPCPCPDTPGTTLAGITPTPIHEFRQWGGDCLPAHSPSLIFGSADKNTTFAPARF